MRKPTLVCRASKAGVLILGKKNNTFYPNILKGKLPAKRLTSDEQFIRQCLSGIKNMPREELERLSPRDIEQIEQLHKKAMTRIVRMKEEIARKWTEGILKPYLNKRIPTSEHEMMNELVIRDLEDMHLELDIPRPFLIRELLQLRETL